MLRSSLLVAVVMMATSSQAADGSPCAANTPPIQVNALPWNKEGPITTLSELKTMEHPNALFITAVTEHLVTRLAEKNVCLTPGSNGSRDSLLQFVFWGLTTGERVIPPVPPFDALPPVSGCRIRSPWLDLSIERQPKARVHGIVRWNIRQFLTDQAILAGIKPVPDGVAIPLRQKEYLMLTAEYDRARKPEEETDPIKAGFPPDIFWLFHSIVGPPFSGWLRHLLLDQIANQILHTDVAQQRFNERHTQLITALIDRCFMADGTDLHYNNILEGADVISLDQHRVEIDTQTGEFK